MKRKMESLQTKEVWELVEPPPNWRVIGSVSAIAPLIEFHVFV